MMRMGLAKRNQVSATLEIASSDFSCVWGVCFSTTDNMCTRLYYLHYCSLCNNNLGFVPECVGVKMEIENGVKKYTVRKNGTLVSSSDSNDVTWMSGQCDSCKYCGVLYLYTPCSNSWIPSQFHKQSILEFGWPQIPLFTRQSSTLFSNL